MDEEVLDQEVNENQESEIEAKARTMGWRPKEEYSGDTSNWVDAEEFVGRAPLYEGLSKQGKKIKQMERQLNAMMEHNKQIHERNKQAQIEELESQKREALDEQDHNKVIEVDRKIRETEQEPAPDVNQGINPAFVDWVEDNEWYTDNPDLAAIADRRGELLYQQNPNRPVEEIYKEVGEYIRGTYIKEESTAPPPDGGSRQTRKASAKDTSPAALEAKLTEEQRKMMNEYVNDLELMTKEEYIEQLVAAGTI